MLENESLDVFLFVCLFVCLFVLAKIEESENIEDC